MSKFFSKENFGHFVKIFETGRTAILGRIYGTITLVLLVGTYLAVTGDDIGLPILVVLFIVSMVLMFIIGWIYVRMGLFDAETYSRNLNNPQQMEVLHNTRKILKILGEVKK